MYGSQQRAGDSLPEVVMDYTELEDTVPLSEDNETAAGTKTHQKDCCWTVTAGRTRNCLRPGTGNLNVED